MKKSSFSGTANEATVPDQASPAFIVRIKRYRWAIIWCIFHFCALFLSYNEIRFFNTNGEPKTDKFWPFVKFTTSYFLPDDNTTYFKFNGFFTQYDWTEFSFYVGGALFLILLVRVYKNSE